MNIFKDSGDGFFAVSQEASILEQAGVRGCADLAAVPPEAGESGEMSADGQWCLALTQTP